MSDWDDIYSPVASIREVAREDMKSQLASKIVGPDWLQISENERLLSPKFTPPSG